MNNPDTDLIFPLRILPLIAGSRDAEWKALADFVGSDEADMLDKLALVLMMVKLAGCVSCNSDSFRAMRGCTQCASQTIRRQHTSGAELKLAFLENRKEAESYLKNRANQFDGIDGKIGD